MQYGVVFLVTFGVSAMLQFPALIYFVGLIFSVSSKTLFQIGLGGFCACRAAVELGSERVETRLLWVIWHLLTSCELVTWVL